MIEPVTDLCEIGTPGLSAGIDPLGAELHYLRDADGRDLLWDGDPAVWSGRAPVLFPIVGMVRDDRYRIGDRHWTMHKHGFARRKRFAVVAQDTASVTLRLEADERTRAAYPFDFRLDLRFSIAGAALEMAATVRNLGDAAMPASFGFHPALRWPLPYGRPRAGHRIRFAASEPAPIRRIDAAGLLTPDAHPTPIAGDTLVLDDALFTDDAIILDRPASRALRYGAEDGPQLAVSYPDMPLLGLWTKPGANYICIEPWQGVADPVNFAGEIFDKPAMLTLPPGEARCFAMTIALVDPD